MISESKTGEFQKVILFALKRFTAREVSARLGVGTSQIMRWARGGSEPLEPMQRTVMRSFAIADEQADGIRGGG